MSSIKGYFFDLREEVEQGPTLTSTSPAPKKDIGAPYLSMSSNLKGILLYLHEAQGLYMSRSGQTAMAFRKQGTY